MKLNRALLAVPVLAACLAAAAPAAAQTRISGTFVRDASAGADMKEVMDNAVGKVKNPLGRLFTGVSRNRLRDVIAPYAWIQIASGANGSAHVRTDRWGKAVLGGSAETWDRTEMAVVPAGNTPDDDHDIVRVTTSRQQNGAIKQTFKAEDGSRTNVYKLSPDGNTLTMDVTIESGQLSGPLNYSLVYKRNAS